jgi:hypothetical protein
MNIEYDKPIQVNFGELQYLRKHYNGIFAWRRDENNNFWIKVWLMNYAKTIEKILNP